MLQSIYIPVEMPAGDSLSEEVLSKKLNFWTKLELQQMDNCDRVTKLSQVLIVVNFQFLCKRK